MGLDISKLIEVGEDIYHDDQLGFAEQIEKPFQEATDQHGRKYQLYVGIKMIKDGDVGTEED